MTENLLERIRRLCQRLVEIAPWWDGWWRPMAERRLSGFERDHAIVLPDGYRRLLVEIGDRAPIPGRPRGGLIEFEEALVGTTVAELLGPLDRPFPTAGEDTLDLEWDEDADDTPLAGCLPIVDGGCDLTYLLVVTAR